MFASTDGSTRLKRLAIWLVLVLVGMALAPFSVQSQSVAQSGRGSAAILTVNGAIGPATASYVGKGLKEARERNAQIVVLAMDTPGGLDTSMRDIIRDILSSPIPVVSYVTPSGARAASAGTYILYASHIAAMTPGTNLGAATPIQVGGSPTMPGGEPSEKGKDKEDTAPAPKNASEKKAVNDAVAYIRSLAEMRDRNADWAEKAVREAASLSANAALEQKVIDVVAKDVPALLAQLDGRAITLGGAERTLHTAGLSPVEIEPDWTTRLLATITDPNIALLLMMIGVYGLIFEFMNPGAMVPGTIGAISLIIGLYALAALPVDFAGLALIALGLALMVGEAFAPSFGVLGIGGLAAFVFGAAILIDTDIPTFQISRSVIAALGVFSAGLILVIGRVGITSLRGRIQTGHEEMIGTRGTVLDWEDGHGHVYAHSERWSAKGPTTLSEGASVIVEAIEGLTLEVSPTQQDADSITDGR